MRTLLILVAGALVAGATLQGETAPEEFNFKVGTMEDSSGEGPERNRPFFSLGTRKVAFAQATDTTVFSDPAQLTISLTKRGITGEIIVRKSAFTPAKDIVVNVAEYHAAAEGTVPAEADQGSVEFLGAKTDLYAVNEYACLSFEWVYSFHARRLRKQVAYINLDDKHQVSLTIVCDDHQWAKAQAIARRFIASWYFPTPGGKRYRR